MSTTHTLTFHPSSSLAAIYDTVVLDHLFHCFSNAQLLRTMVSHEVEDLRLKVQKQEFALAELKRQLAVAEVKLSPESNQNGASPSNVLDPDNTSREYTPAALTPQWPWPLAAEEYKRYGRQMILPEIGLQGQGTAVHAACHH